MTAIGMTDSAAAIEHFWFMVEHGWDIEPRAYFEKEATAMGFRSAVEMAVHHMWKRHAKVWPNAELAARNRTAGSSETPTEPQP